MTSLRASAADLCSALAAPICPLQSGAPDARNSSRPCSAHAALACPGRRVVPPVCARCSCLGCLSGRGPREFLLQPFIRSSSAMHRKVNVLFHACCSHLLNPAGPAPSLSVRSEQRTQRHQQTNIDEWDTQTQQMTPLAATDAAKAVASLASIAQRSGCEPPRRTWAGLNVGALDHSSPAAAPRSRERNGLSPAPAGEAAR